MWWSALCLPPDTPCTELSWWALGFTPRVTCVDEAVLMELAASARLFGGRRVLRERVQAEALAQGVTQIAWASNGLAALALARAGRSDTGAHTLVDALDALPMAVLSAVWPHQRTLAQTGCRTLGDLRRLPRSGLGRRFGQPLLHALDQVYGQAPEAHDWVSLPEVFEARLELMSRVDEAGALIVGARHLLQQMVRWLLARRSGVTAFSLRWAHDAMRSREVGAGDALTVRTAEATRDAEHLERLLAEHLARVHLQAPVGELWLHASEVQPLVERSQSWLPDALNPTEALPRVLERIAIRLGPQRVQRPRLVADHRPEAMCQWQSSAAPLPVVRLEGQGSELPQPAFLLPEPLKLAVRAHRPLYQGELRLLLGPQRIEGGWWDRDETGERTRHVARDYWVAFSEHAGLLWVFQTRLAHEPAWYLHGLFG